MASYKLMFSLAAMLLVLLPMVTKGSILTPALAPFYEELCNQVECGKGTCKAGAEYKFGYICECDAGWKHTRLGADYEDNLEYLPCVIPNCTLDYSCMPAAAPTPSNPHNASVFDPCYWMYCGEGTCNKSSTYTYKFSCQCDSGYKNLLNNTYYPCYSDCALTSDCERLGIKVSNSTSSSDGSDSQASTFLPGKFHLVGIMVISMVVALWK